MRYRIKNRKTVIVSFRVVNPPGIESFTGTIRGLRTLVKWNVRLFTEPLRLTRSDVRNAKKNGVDGILIAHPLQTDLTIELLRSDIPLVVLGNTDQRLFKRRTNVAFVEADNRLIGAMAANHFRDLGKFRTYAFLPDTPTSRWSRVRLRGYRTALRKAGEAVEVFSGDDLGTWLRALKKPVALFLSGDYLAANTMSVCEKEGLKIPSDISLLGVDNNPILCESTPVPLSSIEPTFEKSGYEAVRILQELMTSRKPRLRPIIYKSPPARIVERTSTTRTRPSAEVVECALRFINANVERGITAKDVARHVGVSQQLLSLRFSEIEKKSVCETIILTRLAKVQKFLSTTSLPLAKIAKQTGYRSESHLAHQFAKRIGIAPGQWRDRQRKHSWSPPIASGTNAEHNAVLVFG